MIAGSGEALRGGDERVPALAAALARPEMSNQAIYAKGGSVASSPEWAQRSVGMLETAMNLDPAAVAGGRISDVMVKDGDNWVPIDPAATYGVVSNNYMRNGGDGYTAFEANATDVYDFGPDLADVLAEYLAGKGPGFAPALDGRITVR